MTWILNCVAAIAAVIALGACSPALDWREFTPEGSGLGMSFPCRTDRHARSLAIAGERVEMEMLVCSSGDATWAVSFFDVSDPARVSAALIAWRTTAIANVQGTSAPPLPMQVKGMTPNPEAVKLAITGKLPDGAPVQEHAAFFARGMRVYSATVIGAKPPEPAVETFFGGLRFPG